MLSASRNQAPSFFECSYSQEVWTNLLRQLLLSRFTYKWQDIMVLLADRSQTTLKLFLLRYSFQVTLYSIWRERNNRRHGSQPILASQLIKLIDRQIHNKCLLMISKRIRHHEGVLQIWILHTLIVSPSALFSIIMFGF